MGYVDPEIMYFVDKINEFKDYYTTSSCIGRCGIMEFPKGKNPKIYSKWLGKWHHLACVITSYSIHYTKLYDFLYTFGTGDRRCFYKGVYFPAYGTLSFFSSSCEGKRHYQV